jgi:hypothetical protein
VRSCTTLRPGPSTSEAFVEGVGPLLEAGEGATDDLLGAAEAVGGGGVDPVDAQLERPLDRGDRVAVLLRPPAELPAGAADRPSAEPDAGDLEPGRAELNRP